MALSYKTRRRLSLLVLIVGLPLYIALAWYLASLLEDVFGRPSVLLELLVYIILGVIWALPLKSVFIGVGQADPDAAGDRAHRKDDDQDAES
jgi:hypothetical protein